MKGSRVRRASILGLSWFTRKLSVGCNRKTAHLRLWPG